MYFNKIILNLIFKINYKYTIQDVLKTENSICNNQIAHIFHRICSHYDIESKIRLKLSGNMRL
jgi:hypothetical protein